MYTKLLQELHEKGIAFDSKLNAAREINSVLILKSDKLIKMIKDLRDSCIAKAEKSPLCGICLEGESNICIQNCGHVYCQGCIDRAARRNNRCPACRGNITSTMKIFF